jgi:hypothetical protein
MAFGRARAQLFRPCDGPIPAALNLHVKGAELTAFAHYTRAREAEPSFGPRRRRFIFGELFLI